MTAKKMTDEEFEEYFDNGGDVTPYIVEGSARRPNREEGRKISVTLPAWLIDEIDEDARHMGNTRQGLMSMWLIEAVRKERRERVA